MRKLEWWDWGLMALCGAWLFGLVFVTSAPGGGIVRFVTHPATAAWAQAIFSAGAVFAAFVVGNSQVRVARIFHDRQQRAVQGVASMAIGEAKSVVRQAAVAAQMAPVAGSIPAWQYMMKTLDRCHDRLAAVPMAQIDSRLLLLAVREAEFIINAAQGIAALVHLEYVAHRKPDSQLGLEFNRLADGIEAILIPDQVFLEGKGPD